MPPPPLPLATATSSVLVEDVAATATAAPDIGPEREQVLSNYYVTLSITRLYTTYTTAILLAGTGAAAPSSQPTISAVGSTDPPSDIVVGAIVGSLLGTFVVVLVIWCCFFRPPVASIESVGSSSSSSIAHFRRSPVPSPRPVRVNIPRVQQVRVSEVREVREVREPSRAARSGSRRGIFQFRTRERHLDDD